MYRNISCRQVVAPNFSIVQVNICGPFTGATRDRPPCWCTEGGLFYFSCIGEEIRLSSAAGVVAPQMNQFPFEAAEEVCWKDSPCCFFAPPQPKGKALWRTSRKIREDLYAIDGLWQYDWKDGFASSTAVLSSKWAPVIAYLKTLATEIL